jgi:hypothetical protein
MGIKYEVTAVTGKYTDRNGNEKNRYTKVGVVLETKNGQMLKVESIPVGWDGWAYLNEPREQGEERKPEKRSGGVADMEDSIPF